MRKDTKILRYSDTKRQKKRNNKEEINAKINPPAGGQNVM